MIEEKGRSGAGGDAEDAVPDLAGEVVELPEAVDVRERALRYVEVAGRIGGSRQPAFRRRLVHVAAGARPAERALERVQRRAVGVVDRRIAEEDAERDLLGPVLRSATTGEVTTPCATSGTAFGLIEVGFTGQPGAIVPLALMT